MLREQVITEWKNCQAQVLKFTAEGIGSNYVIMNKRTILDLNNSHLNQPPVELYDLMIENGVVTKKKTRLKSNRVVEVSTELLKVAIIADLAETSEVEEVVLTNYEESQVVPRPIIPSGPTIEEVD